MKIAAFYENISEGAESASITLREAIEQCRADGLEMLYISDYNALQDPEAVAGLLEETGLELEGIHCNVDFTHNADEKHYEEVFRVAKRLGTKHVMLLPGMIPLEEAQPGSDEYEGMKRTAFDALNKAIDRADEMGLVISLEDFDGFQSPYHDVRGLKEYLDAAPGLKCCFDTGNFCMEDEDEIAAYELFKERTVACHLKDRSRTQPVDDMPGLVIRDGSKVYTEITGKGYIRIEEILKKLKADGYQGNVIVELYGYSHREMLKGVREGIRWTAETLRRI